MQLAAARIGSDLKIFNILVDAKNPLTITEVAEKTGNHPDPLLLGESCSTCDTFRDAHRCRIGRLLRYLASIGDIAESDKDVFTASNVTHALAIEGFQGGIHH